MAAKIRAVGAAEEAARAGAGALDQAQLRHGGPPRLDPTHAADAARAYLAATGQSGTVNATANNVTVTVTTRQSAQLLSLVGIDTFSLTGTASAAPVSAITTPPQGNAP